MPPSWPKRRPALDYPLNTADQLRHQLRALRKQRGMTQAALGALIGVTQARVVEIEANPGAVSLQQVMQVLNALGAGFVMRELQPAALPPAPPSPARRRAGTVPSGHGAGTAPSSQTAGTAPAGQGASAGTPPSRVKKGSW